MESKILIPTAGIVPELSRSWPIRQAKEIPPFVDVFCIAGIEPDSDRYVDWGYFEATSEPCPWPQCRGHIEVVASVTVPLVTKSEDALKRALKQGCDLLNAKVWKGPEWLKFRNKLAEDLLYWRMSRNRGAASLPIERVDPRDLPASLDIGMVR
jgi:hypothetical protein